MSGKGDPHPWRCETCRKWSQKDCPPYREIDDMDWQFLQELTALMGCASHSSAAKAEQRIADAIRVLEWVRESELTMDRENGVSSTTSSVDEAISLLKGDGK